MPTLIASATAADVASCNALEPPSAGVAIGGGIHVAIPTNWRDLVRAGTDVPGCTYYKARADGSILVSDNAKTLAANWVIARGVSATNFAAFQTKVGLSVNNDVLLIVWGQSNAIEYGGGVLPFASFLTGESSVWYWMQETDNSYAVSQGTGSATGSSGNAFVSAARITSTITPHSPPFLYGLRALQNAGVNRQAMMVARQGTTLYADWDPAAVSGLQLFNVLTHEVDAALAAASFTLNAGCRIVWLSYIGEADSTDATFAAQYQARYQAIITALKARYTGHDHVFLITKTNYTGVANATVRAAQDALAIANARTYTIETTDMPIVQPHYKCGILGAIAARGLRAALGLSTVAMTHAASGDGYIIDGANRLLSGAQAMTNVAYLIKTAAGVLTTSVKYLFRCTDTGAVGYAFYLLPPVSPTGGETAKVGLNIVDGGGTHRALSFGNVALQQNVIHQLAFTFDGANVRLYLDAIQVGAAQAVAGYTPQSTATNGNQLGQLAGGVLVDEIGIVAFASSETNALTQADLQAALYAARASDDFSIAHQTMLLNAITCSKTASPAADSWFDAGLRLSPGFYADDGLALLDYREAAYA